MKIDTAGTYTLRYSATDQCGNVATKDRVLTVVSKRTVLYSDGTFIINELPQDRAENEALHGAATNEYIPFNPNGETDVERYEFENLYKAPWYAEKTSVKSVRVGSQVSPKSVDYWFSDMTSCTEIDLTNIDTSSVQSMSGMFNNCKALTSIDISNLNTSSVTNMSSMFRDCSALVNANFGNIDTSKVTDMTYMFEECRALISLDFSTLDTGAVESMRDMFSYCIALSNLNLSGVDTKNVTTMAGMFYYAMALPELDLSSFDTQKTTRMGAMFGRCLELSKIYASSDFVTTQVTDSGNMFNTNSKLVGGAGTAYSDSKPTDKTYARIDNPPNEPGYFTAKTA